MEISTARKDYWETCYNNGMRWCFHTIVSHQLQIHGIPMYVMNDAICLTWLGMYFVVLQVI